MKTENEKALIEALFIASIWDSQLTDREKMIAAYPARIAVITRIFEQYKDKIIQCCKNK